MSAAVISQTRSATCPTCHHTVSFEFAYVQHWPKRVADALDLPTKMYYWHCPHCQSTLSELELLPPR